MGECDIEDAECSFTCTMEEVDNEVFTDFLQCCADVDCLPDYPEDGICLAEDDEALQVSEQINLCTSGRFRVYRGPTVWYVQVQGFLPG